MRKLAILAFSVLTAEKAAAQDADWAYKATLYGWFPGMTTSVDTRFGTVESEASGSDVLSNLDMAFLGSFSAQRGRLGFVGDLLYTNLSTSRDTPLALYGVGTVDVKVTALSGYALYRVSNSPKIRLDLGAGFRVFDANIDVSLRSGALPGGSENISSTWTAPLIAARVAVPLNESWFLTGFADWGGAGSEEETWQVYGGVGYSFNEKWSSQLGYRHMDINKQIDGRDVSVELDGAVLALSYSF